MIQKENISQLVTSQIIETLGLRFKDYRIVSDLTQQEVSDKSGVSVVTIRKFENGNLYDLKMGTLIALLKAINFTQGLDELLPEIPISPYELEKIQQGKRKRVRHEK